MASTEKARKVIKPAGQIYVSPCSPESFLTFELAFFFYNMRKYFMDPQKLSKQTKTFRIALLQFFAPKACL